MTVQAKAEKPEAETVEVAQTKWHIKTCRNEKYSPSPMHLSMRHNEKIKLNNWKALQVKYRTNLLFLWSYTHSTIHGTDKSYAVVPLVENLCKWYCTKKRRMPRIHLCAPTNSEVAKVVLFLKSRNSFAIEEWKIKLDFVVFFLHGNFTNLFVK